MTSILDGPGGHDDTADDRPDADERARRVLQAQAWPTLDRPLIFAHTSPQPRRQAGQWMMWSLALGCLAALALVIVVAGSGQTKPPATGPTALSGQILCLGADAEPRLLGVDPESGAQTDLGRLAIDTGDGFKPNGQDEWMMSSPDGGAVAFAKPVDRSEQFGFRLSIRSLQPDARPLVVTLPEVDKTLTSFAWSPSGDGILYLAEDLTPNMSAIPTPGPDADREFRVPSAFELHQVWLDRDPDGGITATDSKIVWQRTAQDLDGALNVALVGWDDVHHRAALVIQFRGSDVKAQLSLVDLVSGEMAATIPLGSVYAMDWASPDGRWVAHAECPKPQEHCQAATGSVWLIELATGQVMEIPAVDAARRPAFFVWSRDSTHLAWREWLADSGEKPSSVVRLAEVGRDGPSSTRVIASGVDLAPIVFSPAADVLVVAESPEQSMPPTAYRAYPVAAGSAGEPQVVVGWGKSCWAWVDAPAPKLVAVATTLPPEPSAWSDDAGLWVRDAGGPPRLLVAEANVWTGRDPIISPDGQWVGYIVSIDDKLGTFSNELQVVSWTDGSMRQRVVGNDLSVDDLSDTAGRRGILNPVWSPDSRMIAFDTISAANAVMPHSYGDLWTLDIGSGKVTRVLDEGKAGGFVFSPDGTMFAVATDGSFGRNDKSIVKVLRIDGSGERELFEHPKIITYTGGWGSASLQWSPDGASLLMVLPAPDPSQELLDVYSPTAQLYRLPLDGKPELLSTVNDLVGGAYSVKWSPDARHTAYVVTSAAPSAAATAIDATGYPAPVDPSSFTDLIIAGPDGRGGQTVARGPNLAFEGWLPDSRHYRYSQRSGTGQRVVAEGELP